MTTPAELLRRFQESLEVPKPPQTPGFGRGSFVEEKMSADPLRPADWSSYVGQRELKDRLEVHIQAAVADDRALEHTLLAAPPGFGKTSLAAIIASKMNSGIGSYIMPLEERALVGVFRGYVEILFFDELHRATKKQQERFLPLLEDGYLQLPNGERIQAGRRFTMIGATTEPQLIIPPLYDRFVIKPTFEDYTKEEMAEIVRGMAERVGVPLADETLTGIARAAGGTPRNGRQLVLAARALTVSLDRSPTASEVLGLCQISEDGLSREHERYLTHMWTLGGRAGLTTLCNLLRLHPSVVGDLERLLLRDRLITYSERGRELTSAGYERVKRP